MKIRNRSRPLQGRQKMLAFLSPKRRFLTPTIFLFFFFGQVLLIIDLSCYPSKVKSCFKEDLVALSLPLLSRKFRLLDLAVHTYDFY